MTLIRTGYPASWDVVLWLRCRTAGHNAGERLAGWVSAVSQRADPAASGGVGKPCPPVPYR